MKSENLIHLCPELSLPPEAVTKTFAILAVRGAGKSNTAAVMAEGFYDAALPFCVIDPVGAWWGLRSSFDGKSAGLNIPIFGGKHGDVPLEEGSGEVIADLIAEKRLSCIIDMSLFEDEAPKKRFLLAFARRLYFKNERPLHLILEEADDYVPQKPMGDELRLLRAFENIVRRGRSRGLGITLITQRSAAINKNVLTQTENLMVMRTTGPQDIEAISLWVKYHGQRNELLESLSGMDDGEAWIWSPSWLKVMQRIQVRRRRTFDSGATPKESKTARPAATLADVDLTDLKSKLADTIITAKANDPAELKATIVKLRRERAALDLELEAAKNTKAKEPESVLTTEDSNQIFCLVENIAKLTAEFKRAEPLLEMIWRQGKNNNRIRMPKESVSYVKEEHDQIARKVITRAPSIDREFATRSTGSNCDLGKMERMVLAVLSQFTEGCAIGKLALLAGYRVSGGFRNALSALRGGAYITGDNTGVMKITLKGEQQGPFPKIPEGQARFDYWLNHPSLGLMERKILGVLINSARGLAIDKLAEITGYEVSGGFRNALSALRTAGVIVGKNTETMEASPTLWE